MHSPFNPLFRKSLNIFEELDPNDEVVTYALYALFKHIQTTSTPEIFGNLKVACRRSRPLRRQRRALENRQRLQRENGETWDEQNEEQERVSSLY